jgi:hypothetical protein
MLEPLPARSIARFLLPLTDIMALLFSVFLLLPHLEQHPGEHVGSVESLTPDWTLDRERRAREEIARWQRLIEQPLSQRAQLVVLDIDGNTGNLSFQSRGRQDVLASQADADELIRGQLDVARLNDRDLLFVLRLPRPEDFKSHPDYADEERYRRWFGKWKVDYQIPGLRRQPPAAP